MENCENTVYCKSGRDGFVVLFHFANWARGFPKAEFLIMMYGHRKKSGATLCVSGCDVCKSNGGGVWRCVDSILAVLQSFSRWGGVGRDGVVGHHFTPPIPLHQRWNIIRCLLTFKSCSAAVISIGPAAISVKCPLATLLLHMEDFLSPSVVSLFYFAPSFHLAILSTMPPWSLAAMEGGNLFH